MELLLRMLYCGICELDALWWDLCSGVLVVDSLLVIFVAESLLRMLCCGIFVVDVILWDLCYGNFVVEALLLDICCGCYIVGPL